MRPAQKNMTSDSKNMHPNAKNMLPDWGFMYPEIIIWVTNLLYAPPKSVYATIFSAYVPFEAFMIPRFNDMLLLKSLCSPIRSRLTLSLSSYTFCELLCYDLR